MAWRRQFGRIQILPYGSISSTSKRSGRAPRILVVVLLSHVHEARTRVAAVSCQRLATVAWAAVLASRLVRLRTRGLIQLRMERSHGRVNRKREGSRSVRIKCSPPHMKIRGIHRVGVLVRRHRADRGDGSGSCCGLGLRVGSDGRVDHGCGIFVRALGAGRVMACSSSGCGGRRRDCDGVMRELIGVRCGRWWRRTIQGIGSGNTRRSGSRTVSASSVAGSIGGVGCSSGGFGSLGGSFWSAGLGGRGRSSRFGGFGR